MAGAPEELLNSSQTNELRQGGAFGPDEERGGVLLHRTVQRGLLRALPLGLDPGAIRRPLGLPADGLHAGPRKR